MTPQTLLNHFGSQAAIARAFKVTDAAVLKWIRAGELPPLRVYQAKEMLKGMKRRK
jgi:DNA invertase Pin-like site-specific DNA recombinase